MNLRKDHYHNQKLNGLFGRRLACSNNASGVLSYLCVRLKCAVSRVPAFPGVDLPTANCLQLGGYHNSAEVDVESCRWSPCSTVLQRPSTALRHIFFFNLTNNHSMRNQKAVGRLVVRDRLENKKPLQLQTTDALATAMMKGAAKCDT